MNFGAHDFMIVVSMSVAVASITFVFPALGLSGSNADEANIPNFSMDSDRFDFSGDFPDRPGTPANGELEFNESRDAALSDNVVWLEGDTQGGYELVLLQALDTSKNGNVTLRQWNNGDVVNQSSHEFDSDGELWANTTNEYSVSFGVEQTLNLSTGTEDYHNVVTYRVYDQPESDGGWLGRIPLIGTVYSTAEAVAGTLAWGILVVWWYASYTFEIGLNTIGIFVDVVVFGFGLMSWMVGNYTDIITGASGWAAVFVSIPGVILSLEFTKIAMIGISLLPTT